MEGQAWDPDGEAGAALRAVVGEFGTKALRDELLMKSGLSDSLPGNSHRRERALLEEACRLGVADDIQKRVAGGMVVDGAVQLTAWTVSESSPLDPFGCLWVAREFALVMGYPVTEMPPSDDEEWLSMMSSQTGSVSLMHDGEPVPSELVTGSDGSSTDPVGGWQATAERVRGETAEPVQGETDARVAVLDPVRRPATLGIFAIATLVLGLAQLPWANNGLQSFDVVALAFALASVAFFIGAGLARKPVAVRQGDPLVLLIAGIASVLVAVGFLVRRMRFSFTWPPYVADISFLVSAAGILLFGVLCFVLAVRYAGYRGGPMKQSPVSPCWWQESALSSGGCRIRTRPPGSRTASARMGTTSTS